MRKMLIAAATAGLLMVAAPALADEAGTRETDNNVDCNAGDGFAARTPIVGGVWVAVDGDAEDPASGGALVLCNERSWVQSEDLTVMPIQGRVIVSGDAEGGYVAADGDKDNPEGGTGWARLDLSSSPTVTCGPGNAEDGEGTQEGCDPTA